MNGVESIVPPGGTIHIFPAWSTMKSLLLSSGASTTDKGDTRLSAINFSDADSVAGCTLSFLHPDIQVIRHAVITKRSKSGEILLNTGDFITLI